MNDAGHEAVGQALLISGVAVGVLGLAQLSSLTVAGFDRLIAALG